MSALIHRLRMWLRALFNRGGADRELAREMESHIAMERDRLIRQGVAPDEAERRARVAFGGVQRHTEAVRDERGTRWLDNFAQDVRFAFRQYLRTPWSTATIVVMLALGIGANAFLFAVVDHVAFTPGVGIARDGSIVRIRGIAFMQSREFSRELTLDELDEYREKRAVFAGVAGLSRRDEAIVRTRDGEPTTQGIQFMTNGYLALLGVTPVLGRILPTEPDSGVAATPSAFISHRFWRAQLGGADVIGQQLNVGSAIVTIVGVAPPGFDAGATSSTPHVGLWLSLSAWQGASGAATPLRGTYARFHGIARLADGVSMARANAVASSIGTSAAALWTREKVITSSDVVPLRANNRDAAGRDDTWTLIAMLAAITLLAAAVIGTNVSALMLARAVTRQREIGVRLSLGATRWRLVRQLLTESTILAGIAGFVGLSLLVLLFRFVNSSMSDDHVGIATWAVVATMAFSIGLGILFGLSPALHATRASVFDSLKGSSASGTRATRGQRRLVIAQIALSQPLLVGVGVLVMTIVDIERGRGRSDVESRIVMLEVATHTRAQQNGESPGLRVAEQIVGVLSEMPGVERVSATTNWQSGGNFAIDPDDAAGIGAATFRATTHPIAPGYFDLMGGPMVRGREFDRTDIAGGAPAIIIGSDDATHLFGAADPVGRKLRCALYCEHREFTIVGVADARLTGTRSESGNIDLFVVAAQKKNFDDPTILVRVQGEGNAMANVVRERVREAFPNQPVAAATTLAERNSAHRRENALTAAGATAGGLLALALAAIGLYAIVSFAVQQRLREIGVRIALGARPVQVVRHFFREGFIVSIAGCAIGLPASVFAIRALAWALPFDIPGTVGVAAVIALAVSAVAMFATWLPARRAAGVDPIRTLRQE